MKLTREQLERVAQEIPEVDELPPPAARSSRGPDVEGAMQVALGLYVADRSTSVFAPQGADPRDARIRELEARLSVRTAERDAAQIFLDAAREERDAFMCQCDAARADLAAAEKVIEIMRPVIRAASEYEDRSGDAANDAHRYAAGDAALLASIREQDEAKTALQDAIDEALWPAEKALREYDARKERGHGDE